MIVAGIIEYIESTIQALHVAAKDLAELQQAGLTRCPADILLDEAIEVLRANCEVGQLRLEISWQDRLAAPQIQWHLCSTEATIQANALSALLRSFGLTAVQSENVGRLAEILNPQKDGRDANE